MYTVHTRAVLTGVLWFVSIDLSFCLYFYEYVYFPLGQCCLVLCVFSPDVSSIVYSTSTGDCLERSLSLKWPVMCWVGCYTLLTVPPLQQTTGWRWLARGWGEKPSLLYCVKIKQVINYVILWLRSICSFYNLLSLSNRLGVLETWVLVSRPNFQKSLGLGLDA